MAHFLEGYEGKCANVHGHRYRLIVYIEAETLHEEGHLRGMVNDFSLVKKSLREVEELFDHKLLIEDSEFGRRVAEGLAFADFKLLLLPFRPTCEEMSRYIFGLLREKGVNPARVELFETPTNSCIYGE